MRDVESAAKSGNERAQLALDMYFYRIKKYIGAYAAAMGGVDIIVTHAPPRGFGDAPDNAHRGFESFLPLMDEFHPRFLIHGHVHPRYGDNNPQSVQYGETIVFNAVGKHMIEIEPDPNLKIGGVQNFLKSLIPL